MPGRRAPKKEVALKRFGRLVHPAVHDYPWIASA